MSATASTASAACRRRTSCRLCGSSDLALVLELTPTPPANAFVPASALARDQQRFPLDVFFCRSCAHLQLLDVVDPALLFEDYVYVSGTSPVFVAHFQRYAQDCVERFGLKPDDLVVEIGSNDGTLLRFFKDAGMRVLGIDPAKEIARRATAAGLETWAAFFDEPLARRIGRERGSAKLVVANNVFAHIDDLPGVARGVRTLLAPDGAFVFEVSYLADVHEKTLFDTIYHEHLDYHSVGPLVPFFAEHGMRMVRASRVDSHGGSLRGVAARADGPLRDDGSVEALVAAERARGLDREDTFRAFSRQIDGVGATLRNMIRALKAEGKRIAGFGAPAKATTLLYHFGLGPQELDFIVDDSPLKQGLYSPGMKIPVLSSSAIADRKPDVLVILAWNFAEPIMAKQAAFKAAGGRFIVPLPTPKLI
ncbi:MAG: class I SAM-dependent methyltransferase [Alphaproteobacteria bacterium]|nr:class I SAM-dependent methyltransferase [Alphaproteobacteria bacterium]